MNEHARHPEGQRAPWLVLSWLGYAILVITAIGFAGWIVAQPYIGWDRTVLLDGVRRWLDTGTPYPAFQLAGSFATKVSFLPTWLYPPPALLLFAPFLVLPAVAWWAIPAALVTWSVWRDKPGPVGRALIALCLAYPGTWIALQWGNASMLFAGVIVLALRFPAFGPSILVKPTLLPFALVGVRRRAWWVSLAAGLLVCLAFGGLWAAWWTSTHNVTDNGLTYSLTQFPLLAVPILARLRFRRSGEAHPTGDRLERPRGGAAVAPVERGGVAAEPFGAPGG